MDTKDMVDIVDSLMQELTQTPAYIDATANNPAIQDAEARLSDMIDNMGLIWETKDELLSLFYSVVSAYEGVAVLFGMQTMEALRYVSANPAEYSKSVLARIKEVRGEVA